MANQKNPVAPTSTEGATKQGTVNRYVLSGDLLAGRIQTVTAKNGAKTTTKSYYHLDHLNSTKAVTKADGSLEVQYVYRAFGEQLRKLGTGDATYTYGGKELDDATNLYYFNARYYDATTGRFINVDPIQDGTNWYVYCSNNPLGFKDPTGLETEAFDLDNLDGWRLLRNVVNLHFAVGETIGGIAMIAAASAATATTEGLAAPAAVPLAAAGWAFTVDGGVRAISSGLETMMQLTAFAVGLPKGYIGISLDQNPDNLGGYLGAGVDALTGDKTQTGKKVGSFANDVASLAGGSASLVKSFFEQGKASGLHTAAGALNDMVGTVDGATGVAQEATDLSAQSPPQKGKK